MRLGRALLPAGRHEEAAERLRLVLDAPPDDDVEYFAALLPGEVEASRGREEHAHLALERAASLFPGAQSPRLALSSLSRERGEDDAVMALLDALERSDRDSARSDPWWTYFSGSEETANRLLNEWSAAVVRRGARKGCRLGRRRVDGGPRTKPPRSVTTTSTQTASTRLENVGAWAVTMVAVAAQRSPRRSTGAHRCRTTRSRRPRDHVATVAGLEENRFPGYNDLGAPFAIGYIKEVIGVKPGRAGGSSRFLRGEVAADDALINDNGIRPPI